MAAGLDELIDFLLSEIALCGVQGAGSADFLRLLERFYNQSRSDGDEHCEPVLPRGGLGRTFQERVWQWVCNHPDIRITHKNNVCTYSLSEFEAAELRETQTTEPNHSNCVDQTLNESAQPPKGLVALRKNIREQLTKEKHSLPSHSPQSEAVIHAPSQRASRNFPRSSHHVPPVFEAPEAAITAPRLYASQSRIWQALTGHGIDLKKVPAMEFVLLSLIAARGSTGITQPELTAISGQDKRSVPNRTNELARKGYIVKNPVQSGKIRTSLCVHAKFYFEGHFLSSGAVEDVFQEGTFVLSGFVQLLYLKLKDAEIVPTRDLRTKLGVPMSTWNKRATQGALIRLDQTGMIKRFRVRRKHTDQSWVTCIQILRAPRDEDVHNLGFRFRRQPGDAMNELLDEDVDGDTLMRDLEVDMLDDVDSDVESDADARRNVDEADRIPPQWTPDRFLANIAFEVIALGGASGWDAGKIRDRIVGPFWRRPMESYLTRLTDDWEKTQPLPFRHLGIIRDTRNTEEKKFLHYVYRTYGNFQAAVNAGEVHWEGVCKPVFVEDVTQKDGGRKIDAKDQATFNIWGFHDYSSADFLKDNGSASLSEVRSAIVHPRKYGSRWDNALNLEIGYQKHETPVTKKDGKSDGRRRESVDASGHRILNTSDSKKKAPYLALTPEQRISLGLKPNGRLSKSAEEQILAHRANSGDPNSLPESIAEKPAKSGRLPLMSAEERIALGLQPRGRLGLARENQIRAERGLAKLVKKTPKKDKRSTNEPALLTKDQRLAFGWKGHGRLPQELMDGLREERKNGIPLEKSIIVPKYMDILKAKAAAPVGSHSQGTIEPEPIVNRDSPASPMTAVGTDTSAGRPESKAEEQVISSASVLGKRKVSHTSSASPTPKRQRALVTHQDEGVVSERSPHQSPTDHLSVQENPGVSVTNGHSLEIADDHRTVAETLKNVAEGEIQTAPDSSPSLESNSMPPMITVENSPAPTAKTGGKEAPMSSTLPAWFNPDISTLNKRDRAIYNSWTSRSMPGFYVNPFARHRAGRGRPRKAFIATFRLPRLKDLNGFHDISRPLVKKISRNTPKSVQASMDEEHQSAVRIPSMASTGTLSPSTKPPRPKRTMHSVKKIPVQPNRDNRAETGTFEKETNARTLADPIRQDSLNEVQLVEQNIETAPEIQPETSANDSLQNISTQSGTTTPLSVIDTSELNKDSRDQEHTPRGPSLEANSTPLPDPLQPLTNTRTSNVAEASSKRSGRRFSDQTLLSPGEYGAISEVPIPVPPRSKPRSKKDSNYEGSSLLFRRKIIQEIIDLCDGAFPDGGEIGRPFHTLWNQRHGNMAGLKEPIASTVNSTLRNMCHDQRFGLKQMSFLVKNKNGPFASKKWMIVYSHYTSRSPQVADLAHKMAHFSLEKSHQYFPEQIRHLVDESSLYCPMPEPPKDESVILNQLNAELVAAKKEAKRQRINEVARLKRLEAKARKAQKAQEKAQEKAQAKLAALKEQQDSSDYMQRMRLASLNDKSTRYTRAQMPEESPDLLDEEFESAATTDTPSTSNGLSEGYRFVPLRPLITPQINASSVDDDLDDAEDNPLLETNQDDTVDQTLATSVEMVLPANTIISVEDGVTENAQQNIPDGVQHPVVVSTLLPNSTKRPGGKDPVEAPPKKKARFSDDHLSSASDEEYVQDSSYESDSSLSSMPDLDDEETDEGGEESEDTDNVPIKANKKRRRTFRGRQVGKSGPLPTILERLTGLTGNPNDPIYQPPQRNQRTAKKPQPLSEKRPRDLLSKKERKSAEFPDPVDKFKKISFTLVIAASMSGEDGQVDWRIVEKAYSNDKTFDIARAKKLWTWMQINMAGQLAELTTIFESSFLEAYEQGRVAALEDSDTYDWASLVRWTMRTCAYPEFLPLYREGLSQFSVDESSRVILDRARWYKDKLADRKRARAQLHSTFTEPLHRFKCLEKPQNDTALKARSWVRANTATPQAIYNGNQAHDKLRVLGDSIFTSVVGDYVEKKSLRMRKLKRLLPGRNYNFTGAFARKFIRPFELGDFMIAVQTKKKLDAAFADEKPENRFYKISRSEEDGSLAAIMNLFADGKVRLVPQLPPVNNEFGAPLPRLTIWGFCEGDYTHRSIDRERFFWDIHVMPTAHYRFGSPLQPQLAPLEPTMSDKVTEWPKLPDAPLPGKIDRDALLPIWSSIDGQTITWPWWYRILNVVLQPLIFQPGATVMDIYTHCAEHITEIFEVELVLDWLESVNAVRKIDGGGHIVLPGFWAAFGDKLLGTEDDWFGEHVKRRIKRNEVQGWRKAYNLKHSTLQAESLQKTDETPAVNGDSATQNGSVAGPSTSKQILQNPRQQYRIMHKNLEAQESSRAAEDAAVPAAQTLPEQHVIPEPLDQTVLPVQAPAAPPNDATEKIVLPSDDIDAEGEIDETMEGM